VLYVQQCSGTHTFCVDHDNIIPTDHIDTIIADYSVKCSTYRHHGTHNIDSKQRYQCAYLEHFSFVLSITNWSLCNINSISQTSDDWSDRWYLCRLDRNRRSHLWAVFLLLLLCQTSQEGREEKEVWHSIKKVVQVKPPSRLSRSIFSHWVQVPSQEHYQISHLIRSSQTAEVFLSKSKQIASLLHEQLHQIT
jgi:hypothetical protein